MVDATEQEEEMTYGEYFIYAARTGDIAGMQECLDEEVPIDFQDPISGNCALHMASANNKIEALTFLLAKNACCNLTNKTNNTALHWAALCGHLEVV